MPRFTYCYAECRYAECRYAECYHTEGRYAKFRYSECRGALWLSTKIRKLWTKKFCKIGHFGRIFSKLFQIVLLLTLTKKANNQGYHTYPLLI